MDINKLTLLNLTPDSSYDKLGITNVINCDVSSYTYDIVTAYNEGRKYKKLTNDFLKYLKSISKECQGVICDISKMGSFERFILGIILSNKIEDKEYSIPIVEINNSNKKLYRVSIRNYRYVVHLCKEVSNNIYVSKHMVKSITGQFELLKDKSLVKYIDDNNLIPIMLLSEPEHFISIGFIYSYYKYNNIINANKSLEVPLILNILLNFVENVTA